VYVGRDVSSRDEANPYAEIIFQRIREGLFYGQVTVMILPTNNFDRILTLEVLSYRAAREASGRIDAVTLEPGIRKFPK